MSKWSGALDRAFAVHLKIGGSGGSSGSGRQKDERDSILPMHGHGTTADLPPVPLVPGEGRRPKPRGTAGTGSFPAVVPGRPNQKPADHHGFRVAGTTGTSGTTENGVARETTSFRNSGAITHDGSTVLSEWVEGFAELAAWSRPSKFSQNDWLQLIDDGERFLEQWGAQAASLGWRAVDIFGVHPRAPSARYDAMGLVPLIRGGTVVAIEASRATIRSPGGGLLTYLRLQRAEAVVVWDRGLTEAGVECDPLVGIEEL